jgi:hypothetical protein
MSLDSQNSTGTYLKISEKTGARRSTVIVPSEPLGQIIMTLHSFAHGQDEGCFFPAQTIPSLHRVRFFIANVLVTLECSAYRSSFYTPLMKRDVVVRILILRCHCSA